MCQVHALLQPLVIDVIGGQLVKGNNNICVHTRMRVRARGYTRVRLFACIPAPYAFCAATELSGVSTISLPSRYDLKMAPSSVTLTGGILRSGFLSVRRGGWVRGWVEKHGVGNVKDASKGTVVSREKHSGG